MLVSHTTLDHFLRAVYAKALHACADAHHSVDAHPCVHPFCSKRPTHAAGAHMTARGTQTGEAERGRGGRRPTRQSPAKRSPLGAWLLVRGPMRDTKEHTHTPTDKAAQPPRPPRGKAGTKRPAQAPRRRAAHDTTSLLGPPSPLPPPRPQFARHRCSVSPLGTEGFGAPLRGGANSVAVDPSATVSAGAYPTPSAASPGTASYTAGDAFPLPPQRQRRPPPPHWLPLRPPPRPPLSPSRRGQPHRMLP